MFCLCYTIVYLCTIKLQTINETSNGKGEKRTREVASRAVLGACPGRESDGTCRTFELRTQHLHHLRYAVGKEIHDEREPRRRGRDSDTHGVAQHLTATYSINKQNNATMTTSIEINAKLATEMAADAHAANVEVRGQQGHHTRHNPHGDGMAHKRPPHPYPSRQPRRTARASHQHRAGNDTDVHGSVAGEGRKMRHPGMSGDDGKKTGRKGGGE